MILLSNNLPWFAVQVWTGREKAVARHLNGRCYDHFLPTYKSRRRWSDRIKEVELPLFPGYVFCRLDIGWRLPILTTPGVLQILGVGGTPQAVNETEVAAIQKLCQSALPSQPWSFLEVGEHVRIGCGPLRGLEGIVVDFKGRSRLILSVTLLQRSVAVEVDEAWVNSIRPSPVPRPVNRGRFSVFQRSAQMMPDGLVELAANISGGRDLASGKP
jgi:transcription antitermination factor NusG